MEFFRTIDQRAALPPVLVTAKDRGRGGSGKEEKKIPSGKEEKKVPSGKEEKYPPAPVRPRVQLLGDDDWAGWHGNYHHLTLDQQAIYWMTRFLLLPERRAQLRDAVLGGKDLAPELGELALWSLPPPMLFQDPATHGFRWHDKLLGVSGFRWHDKLLEGWCVKTNLRLGAGIIGAIAGVLEIDSGQTDKSRVRLSPWPASARARLLLHRLDNRTIAAVFAPGTRIEEAKDGKAMQLGEGKALSKDDESLLDADKRVRKNEGALGRLGQVLHTGYRSRILVPLSVADRGRITRLAPGSILDVNPELRSDPKQKYELDLEVWQRATNAFQASRVVALDSIEDAQDILNFLEPAEARSEEKERVVELLGLQVFRIQTSEKDIEAIVGSEQAWACQTIVYVPKGAPFGLFDMSTKDDEAGDDWERVLLPHKTRVRVRSATLDSRNYVMTLYLDCLLKDEPGVEKRRDGGVGVGDMDIGPFAALQSIPRVPKFQFMPTAYSFVSYIMYTLRHMDRIDLGINMDTLESKIAVLRGETKLRDQWEIIRKGFQERVLPPPQTTVEDRVDAGERIVFWNAEHDATLETAFPFPPFSPDSALSKSDRDEILARFQYTELFEKFGEVRVVPKGRDRNFGLKVLTASVKSEKDYKEMITRLDSEMPDVMFLQGYVDYRIPSESDMTVPLRQYEEARRTNVQVSDSKIALNLKVMGQSVYRSGVPKMNDVRKLWPTVPAVLNFWWDYVLVPIKSDPPFTSTVGTDEVERTGILFTSPNMIQRDDHILIKPHLVPFVSAFVVPTLRTTHWPLVLDVWPLGLGGSPPERDNVRREFITERH